MTPVYSLDEVEDAAELIAFALRPRLRPAKDRAYRDLLRRYRTDGPFRQLVERTAHGLGLRVLGAAEDIGVALAAAPNSVFETRMEDYVRIAKQRGEGEKLLHGVIHLAVAALAFPRADDLASDSYTGRVSAEAVDKAVRDTCDRLREKAAQSEAEIDTPSDTPELLKVWSAYARRPEASLTKDKRLAMNSTRGMTTRALNFLVDQGFLTVAGSGEEGWYRTTTRYQLQVRELAATAAFDELLSLGVVPMSSGHLRMVPGQQSGGEAGDRDDRAGELAGMTEELFDV